MHCAAMRPLVWSLMTIGTKRGSPVARASVPATPDRLCTIGS